MPHSGMNPPPPTHRYRGRFAPSPTGPLHFGSLVAAVGSFLAARHAGGDWLVRMEDLDPPREVPGAADDILRALEGFGLHWDGPVMVQSKRHGAYRQAMTDLERQGLLYPCACSRSEIAAAGLWGPAGAIYPGTCRNGAAPGRTLRALRIRTDIDLIEFTDTLQGPQRQWLDQELGDFPIRRGDGIFAYQLAVVVDDAAQGITHVVRGRDLLNSTPRQIYLQRCLGLPTPAYAHLPIAVNDQGEKLSKQTGAAPVDRKNPLPTLLKVLRFLNQNPPSELRDAQLPELWHWAIAHWALDRITQNRP